jgi:hypothetical protein
MNDTGKTVLVAFMLAIIGYCGYQSGYMITDIYLESIGMK